MKPQSSLQHSQEYATCPYPQTNNPVYASIPLLEDNFNIIFPLRLGLPSCVVTFPVCTTPVLHAYYMTHTLSFLLI